MDLYSELRNYVREHQDQHGVSVKQCATRFNCTNQQVVDAATDLELMINTAVGNHGGFRKLTLDKWTLEDLSE